MQHLLLGTWLAMLPAGPIGPDVSTGTRQPAHKAALQTMHTHRLPLFSTFVLFLLLATHAPTASAQTAPPRDPDAASRAAREAVNPLRVIIEASKLKVRSKPDSESAEAAAPDKRVARPATPRPKAPTPLAGAPASAAGASTAEAVPAAPSTVPEATLAKVADPAPTALAAPPPIVPSVPPAVLPLLPLKLAQLVEPSLPESVMRRLNRDVAVEVGFTVNADGSVSGVAIRSSPMKALEASIVEAVGQWRYEPIREARAHAVQLVLRATH